MSDMRRRLETASEIVYAAHSPGLGVLATLFGVGVYLLAGRASGVAGQVAQGMGGVFALFGLVAVFRRDSFRLDLLRRRWQRVRGFWPLLKTTEGSFDSLQRVEVVEDRGYRRGRPSVEWEVWMRSSDDAARIRLLETADEATARRTQEKLAARLGYR